MRRPVYRLRHLQAFLDRQTIQSEPNLDDKSLALIFGISLLLSLLALRTLGLPFLAVVALWAIALLVYLAYKVERRGNRSPSIASWSPEANSALAEVRSFFVDSSLEERMDPEVGDHLNLCCETFLQAKALLDEETWQGVEGPRLDAKESANAALSALMDDVFVVALSGIRGKGHRRDVFAKRMAKENVKSPILASLAEINGQLDELKSEIASATARRQQSGDSVREAISRIAEIRKAEEELRDSIHS